MKMFFSYLIVILLSVGTVEVLRWGTDGQTSANIASLQKEVSELKPCKEQVDRLQTALQLLSRTTWTIHSEHCVGEDEYSKPNEFVYVDLSKSWMRDTAANLKGRQVRFSLKTGLAADGKPEDVMDMLYVELVQ